MSIRDTDISDWETVNADNAPTNGTLIGRDLAGQWRNIKSVARAESTAKQWTKLSSDHVLTANSNPIPLFSAAFASTSGDLTAYFGDSRKVRLTPVDGGDPIYAAVGGSLYSSSITTLTLMPLSGVAVSGTEYYVAIGIDDPLTPSLPAYCQSGTLTIADTSTNGTVTFAVYEPDTNYFIRGNVVSTTSTNTDCTMVTTITKGNANAVIGLGAAPGAGKNTVVSWTLLRETK